MLHDGMGTSYGVSSVSLCSSLFACVLRFPDEAQMILSVQAQKSFKQHNTAQSHKQLCQTETLKLPAPTQLPQSRVNSAAQCLEKLSLISE